MYNNMYAYNQQPNIDRINNQIAELQKMKEQIQQPITPTNLTQNFQIAPTNRETIRYANSLFDVQRENVIGDTPFFSKDMSVLWIKSLNNSIKTYELTEIMPKDDKDLMIENLQLQIKELREEVKNANANVKYTNDTIEDEKPTNVSNVRKSSTKQK